MSKIYYFSSTRSEPLVSPRELKQQLPATIAQTHFIEQTRQQIIQILNGTDPRLLLIMGPCSIHDLKSAEQYAIKVKELATEVSDTFLVVMRVYFEKPRTSFGWKGMMYDPHLNGSHDMNTGLRWMRELLLTLSDLQVPAAAEILDPVSAHYFGDLLSWGCIGARTSSSQIHRQTASGLPMPVAFKNTTEGNVETAINGVLTAAKPHSYIGINEVGCAALIHTEGNPNCHIVLRGGEKAPNYDVSSIRQALNLLRKAQLPLQLIVDCSHDNSRGVYNHQPVVLRSVIDQIVDHNKSIRGVILESHLHAGNQPLSPNPKELEYAVSLTDSCMDWNTTEEAVLEAALQLKKKRKNNTKDSLQDDGAKETALV
ncbi:MAG: Phospho-2-dehydro-3-deoxyheptonate aldolase, Tyr-sensitive [Chlamydiae bacterium]|nr:Phospho-2-dehydro-3-deoxyheptonate aldolase, Tyr-sensitive [Chlamydiota bacterium]